MFIQTEDTPNPDTLKFLPGKKILLDQGTLEFKTKEASSNNFASILFEDENVKSVFIGKDFVTITKKNVDWDSIKPKILSKILEFFSLDESINTPNKKSQDKEENYNDEDLKIVQQIKKLIDERVKLQLLKMVEI